MASKLRITEIGDVSVEGGSVMVKAVDAIRGDIEILIPLGEEHWLFASLAHYRHVGVIPPTEDAQFTYNVTLVEKP